MKINFINNISLTRLSGINKFICIDINSDYVKFTCLIKKEPFYSISKKDSGKNLKIVETRLVRGNDLDRIIGAHIKEIVSKYSFDDAAIIVGINEFKYTTISIPSDTEEVDNWFIENKTKFLPEGRSPDDFTFSYELYKQDENYKNFYIIIARKDFIESVYKACEPAGLKFLGILPFSLSIFPYIDNTKNTLFLDFEETKIYYSFKSSSGNILYRDVFFDIYEPLTVDGIMPVEKRRISVNNLGFFLEELKQTLSLALGTQSLENLEVILLTIPSHFDLTADQVKKILNPDTTFLFNNNENCFFNSSLFAVNKFLNDFDTRLNILSEDNYEKERFSVEKQAGYRVIISSGLVLLFLLLATYLMESFLTGKLAKDEENYIELTAKAGNVEKLKKENSYLNANLSLLTKLKGGRVEFSTLLFDVAKLINSGTSLTDLKLKENSHEYIKVELTGLAYSQQDVAGFMSNIEYSGKFKEVSLVYSSLVNEEGRNLNSNLSGKDYIKFNITAKYYAD